MHSFLTLALYPGDSQSRKKNFYKMDSLKLCIFNESNPACVKKSETEKVPRRNKFLCMENNIMGRTTGNMILI